jgi:taurine dioxygenase
MNFKAERISGALGAVLSGCKLPLRSPGDLGALKRAILEHLVVFIPDQDLQISDLEVLADQLGGSCTMPFIKAISGHPHVTRILREPTDEHNFGNRWHTDLSFAKQPPAYTILFGVEVPEVGGDTIWANQLLAYKLLSSGLQSTLRSLQAVHSARATYGIGGYYQHTAEGRSMKIDASVTAHDEAVHPAIIAHPETGSPILFVNPVYTVRFNGWTADESAALLNTIYGVATTENITCRLRWASHTLVIWDNRATLHNALDDYRGSRREMYRTMVQGSFLEPYRAHAD